MSVELTITNRTRGAVESRWLLRQLRGALKILGVRRGTWTVTVVGDREMAGLHRRTMGMGTTTDVLTFDLRDAETRSELDLDTVVCRDEAVRRAKEMGHEVREELLLYAVHSLLHVRGYDDVTATKAARMHRREDVVLSALGVGSVYAGISGSKSRRGGRGTRRTGP